MLARIAALSLVFAGTVSGSMAGSLDGAIAAANGAARAISAIDLLGARSPGARAAGAISTKSRRLDMPPEDRHAAAAVAAPLPAAILPPDEAPVFVASQMPDDPASTPTGTEALASASTDRASMEVAPSRPVGGSGGGGGGGAFIGGGGGGTGGTGGNTGAGPGGGNGGDNGQVPPAPPGTPTPSQPTSQPTSPVPEPGSWALLLVAFGALGMRLRRQRAAADRRTGVEEIA